MSANWEELESLLLEWESETLDDAGVVRLRELLKSDPQARQRFVHLQMLDAALHIEGDTGLSSRDLESESSNPVQPTTRTDRSTKSKYGWLAAIAAALACLLAGRLAYVEWDRKSDVPIAAAVEPTSSGIALVTRVVGVDWGNGDPLVAGDALQPGPLRFDHGLVQVEFFCGATVIIEGPAYLDLESAKLARVHSGRLRAQVPPAARGFTIDTSDLKVVDLGTEFGVSVTPEGASVEVFDGEVELHEATGEPRLLAAGQAVAQQAGGDYLDRDSSPERFVDIATMDARQQRQQDDRYQRWRDWSQSIRQDPRLITYYAFDDESNWNRRLQNSQAPPNTELDGATVGAKRVAGRWPGKDGLEFKQPGDRVRVQIPGEFNSLTLACWAKIDSLDRMFNSLFLTDEYNQGEPHWQILDTGQLYFSVRPAEIGSDGPKDKKVLSDPFWLPSMSGKWIHLATTFDVETNEVIHYLNGRVLHRETIPAEQSLKTTRIGTASIGNWSSPTLPDAKFAIRNLNGTIDEFALFNSALSSEEIRSMFENGSP